MSIKGPKEIRLFILGVLGVSVVAVVVTVVVMTTSNGAHRLSNIQKQAVGLTSTLSSLDVSSFQIPERYTEAWKQRWFPSRSREKKWTWDEVQRFWRDPRRSALSSITAENDRKLHELFQGVK